MLNKICSFVNLLLFKTIGLQISLIWRSGTISYQFFTKLLQLNVRYILKEFMENGPQPNIYGISTKCKIINANAVKDCIKIGSIFLVPLQSQSALFSSSN